MGDLGHGYFEERIEAFVVPPAGWKLDPPKLSEDHAHFVWISPEGGTAYGVIYFRVPMIAALIPNGKFLHERALGGFIDQYAKDQGTATLVESTWDDDRNAMRFIAEGGLYRIRTILSVRERSGWAVYAGTLLSKPTVASDLKVAELSRETTRVGLDAEGGAESAMEMLKKVLPGE